MPEPEEVVEAVAEKVETEAPVAVAEESLDVAADAVSAVEIDYHAGHNHSQWPASNFLSKANSVNPVAEPSGTSWSAWFFYVLILGTVVFGSYWLITNMNEKAKYAWNHKGKYLKKFWPK
jgi:hypothetical protein